MNIILMLPTRVEEGDKQEITTTTTGLLFIYNI